MKRIILSVINDLATDQRVNRVALTLSRLGADVTLVGRILPNSLPLNRPYRTHRMRLFFSKKVFFYAEYNIRLFFYLLFKKVDILVSNDLDTLPANYLVSVLRKKDLVYDSHEYFTGMPEIINRKIVYKLWKGIEQFIFPKLEHIYTVNDSIAGLYAKEYNKKIHVVRNVPIKIVKENWPDRKKLGLPVNKKILLIQGAGINIHRGVEEAVQAMQFLDNHLLLIIGTGEVIGSLKKMVSEMKLSGKVLFLNKMPYESMMEHTRLADLGLSLDKDTNINYRFSLPNKIFDYIQGGIPVLCSDLVEVANIVRTWDIGRIAPSHDPHCLAEIISEMTSDDDLQLTWKKNAIMAAETLCWEKEEHHLIQIYNKLL